MQLAGESRIFEALSKDEFFAAKRAQAVDLTYADVHVATGPSYVDEKEVDLTSRFSRNIELKVPFVSAAMDTVTESKMAIAMAMLGGLGVIHAAMTPKQQKKEVRDVKYRLSAVIESPRVVAPDRSLQSILNECEKKGWPFRTFPVLENNGKVLGMITGSAFKYNQRSLDDTSAGQAMKQLSDMTHGSPDTTVSEAYDIMSDRMIGTVPLLNSDGTLAGMYLWSNVESIINGESAAYNLDSRGRLRTAIAVSTHPSAAERVHLVNGDDNYLDVVVIDTSKGDGKHAPRTLKLLKNEFPSIDIVVGNVSEPEGAYMLAEAGADGVKVGQGPGSICTTRLEIGIGSPQVTAIYNCVEALRGMDVPVCADGGIQNFGDLNIAIAAGASSIMMGGMFAATEEAPGPKYRDARGNQVKGYRGMASASSLRESQAARLRYGQRLSTVILPEGIATELPFKGPVEEIFAKAALALRRGIAAGRSPSVDYHREHARFRFHTDSGISESRPHSVIAQV